jgi:hypothetical protein
LRNDWKKIEENKRSLGKRLAALPYAEKLRLLDRMRERNLAIRNAKEIKPMTEDRFSKG